MVRDVRKILRDVACCATHARRPMRRLFMSVIVFTLTFVLLVSSSFSWFTQKNSQLDVVNFELDCGKGLRVNDTGTSQLSYTEVDKTLTPASSVDGRNLFFPTDGSDFSSVTNSMTFRSANAGDKNQNYIQIDFNLTAQQNHTALYINEKKTSIKVKESHEQDWSITKGAALRSALWCSTAENGFPNTPIVFNPTSSTIRTAAVEEVDSSTGAFISTGKQVAHAFTDYSFGGQPVATLERGKDTKFSYIIWLEGADPKCTDKITNLQIQIKLAFTTSWDKTETIRFKDETTNNAVRSLINDSVNPYSLTLHYEDDNDVGNQSNTSMDFNMFKYNNSDDTWCCNIPGDMRKNISFILRPKHNGTTYVFDSDENDNSTLDRESNRLYIADNLNSQTSSCYGHWKAIGDSDGSGHDSGGGFDGDDF